jgi:hypothetical protein
MRQIIQEGLNQHKIEQWAERLIQKGANPEEVEFIKKYFPIVQQHLGQKDILFYSTPEKMQQLYQEVREASKQERLKDKMQDVLVGRMYCLNKQNDYPNIEIVKFKIKDGELNLFYKVAMNQSNLPDMDVLKKDIRMFGFKYVSLHKL